MSESKVSLVNAKVLRVNAQFLRKRKCFLIEGNISLGNAEVLRVQADLADCIFTCCISFTGHSSVSHQDVLRVYMSVSHRHCC